MNHVKHILFILLILCSSKIQCFAQDEDNNDQIILMINSYGGDDQRFLQQMSEFSKIYNKERMPYPIVIECMGCGSFTRAYQWCEQFTQIVEKHGKDKIKLIICWGQEAWASYLSASQEIRDIPVMCALVSRNVVILPQNHAMDPSVKKESLLNTDDWYNFKPESIDALDTNQIKCNLIGGCMYQYGIVENIALIKKIYTGTKQVSFLSDNSYGGVAMQALFRKEMAKNFPEMKLTLLDSRIQSVKELLDTIAKLPEYSALLLGTWRIDKYEKSFLYSSVTSMHDAVISRPVFSMSSAGIGYWAIGGYVPDYDVKHGKLIGQKVIAYLNNENQKSIEVSLIPNRYLFDTQQLNIRNIPMALLPVDIKYINVEKNYWEQYKTQIIVIACIFIFLLVFIFILIWMNMRLRYTQNVLVRSENELMEARDKANESNRLKSAFLANMSHEIRTPLNAIVGFSNIIAETENYEERVEYAEIIRSNNEVLLKLISDILDLSKIESGGMRFTYSDVDVNQLFQDIVQSTSVSLKNKNVSILLDEHSTSCVLWMDKIRLTQVITNFINNALKFTQKGFIKLGYKVNPENIYIYVLDTGCGIPADKLELVFMRFVQLNSFIQGAGLGLAIAQTIVEYLGGKIGVESKEGEGSKFWFTLPKKYLQKYES